MLPHAPDRKWPFSRNAIATVRHRRVLRVGGETAGRGQQDGQLQQAVVIEIITTVIFGSSRRHSLVTRLDNAEQPLLPGRQKRQFLIVVFVQIIDPRDAVAAMVEHGFAMHIFEAG